MSQVTWSIDDVPNKPGVYLFRDAKDQVLYVGKARSLLSRLRSYRRPGGDGRLMMRFLEQQAARVQTIVTRTESEALLLEDSLIKQHKPPHNIRLKDDKSFLMLRVRLGEEFPRLEFVRAHNPRASGSAAGKLAGRTRMFGPFASASAVRQTLADLHRVVPLRDCPDSVFLHRSRPCLKHQIGLCAAPCVGLISKSDYAEQVARALRILGGDAGDLERELTSRMQAAAAELEFERAAQWRNRLQALARTLERQGITASEKTDRDVLALARSGSTAIVHHLVFRAGRLCESRTRTFQSELPDTELWHGVLSALYGPGRRAAPAEILLDSEPEELELLEHMLRASAEPSSDEQAPAQAALSSAQIRVPTRGEGARMLALAQENARQALARAERVQLAGGAGLEDLTRLLDLAEAPEVIDAFDISNFQGAHVVASRVRFRGAQPDKAGYRRFKVRSVEGQDDFASMREVVGRALRRGLEEGDLPDLVVIDGGKGQLDAALSGRDDAGAFDVAIVSLAKARPERKRAGRRLAASEERLFLPGAAESLELRANSSARKLLERLRDEAHRFAITYHRKERGKLRSRLDQVPGLGPVKKKALLRRFGSVAGIERASMEELTGVPGIGADLARAVLDTLAQSARGQDSAGTAPQTGG